MESHPCSLAELENGASARVESVQGGQVLLKRLGAMGIIPGAHLLREEGHGRGPVVVLAKGARLALGHGMASKIMVKKTSRHG